MSGHSDCTDYTDTREL